MTSPVPPVSALSTSSALAAIRWSSWPSTTASGVPGSTSNATSGMPASTAFLIAGWTVSANPWSTMIASTLVFTACSRLSACLSLLPSALDTSSRTPIAFASASAPASHCSK